MLSRIVEPTELPVSLAEFRQHLWNIFDNHDSDTLMEGLIAAATERAETILSRKLITQTWRTTLRGAATGIVLPFGSFQSLAGAAWFDGSSWTALDTADIQVDDTGVLAVVDCDWSGITDEIKQVRVDWVCGYGDQDAIPADIAMAIKQLPAHWYRLRSATTLDADDGIPKVVPFSFSALLQSHRLNFLG
jgi:uncharacterized phiE125 gp8 family phage protein